MGWVAFRADASVHIGSGHVMRCLTLANRLKTIGYESVLLTAVIAPEVSSMLLKHGVVIHELEVKSGTSQTAFYAHSDWLSHSEETDSLVTSNALHEEEASRGSKPSLIVVDHYALAAPWQKLAMAFAPVLAIDDLNDRPHHAQWLLDQTAGKKKADYTSWCTPSTQMLIGAEYALLRPEFAELRAEAFRKRQSTSVLKRILVTLGGVDKDNVTSLVLRAINEANIEKEIQVVVIAGGSNPNYETLKKQVERSQLNIQLFQQVDNMAAFMVDSDLCIGAAGSTSWERCTLGLPTINLVLADNQKIISENLAKLGAAIDFGPLTKKSITSLTETIETVNEQLELLIKMQQRSFAVCDGRGVDRVLEHILK